MSGIRSRLPLYAGGFMGPFGTIVIIPMYPELRDEFDATTAQVSLGFSLYLIPFAILLLFSGTLGERWGRRRTIRGTYLLFAVASIAAALAPSLPIFIVARMFQGVANAFITPLLVAGLAELVPPERLGREVGIYSSFQALGGGLGPVVGGLAADTTWQWAFVGSAIAAGALALFPPPGEPRGGGAEAPSLRPLLTRNMTLLGVAFFFLATGPIGAGVLVGILARDDLGVSGSVAGLIFLSGSLAALVLGPLWGNLLDRFGARRTGLTGIAIVTVMCALLALAKGPIALLLLWATTSASTALTVVVLQALGASILPENRGGALSYLLSFRFLGHAIGPIAFVPVIERTTAWAFVGSAALGIIAWLLVAAGLAGSDLAAERANG